MVTVEMAFAALGLGVAMVFCVGILAVSVGEVRCVDAASQIARQAARDDLGAIAEVEHSLPDSARVDITRDGGQVTVTVSWPMRPWGGWLPAFTVHATAAIADEGGGS